MRHADDVIRWRACVAVEQLASISVTSCDWDAVFNDILLRDVCFDETQLL